jgi:hypothetical protein
MDFLFGSGDPVRRHWVNLGCLIEDTYRYLPRQVGT